jgi:LysM repeat protein
MMPAMTHRAFGATGIGALVVLALAGCGSASGSGAPTQTTVRIGAPNFQTVPPILESTTVAANIAGQTEVVAGEQSYTVQAGDTVVGIARLHCISATPLATYNQWPEGYLHSIFPGDVVKIPPGACAPGSNPEPTAAAQTPPDATTTATDDTSGALTYEVQPGDYLNGIATKLGTTVDAIVAANGWSDGSKHVIIPGQKIKVPDKTG